MSLFAGLFVCTFQVLYPNQRTILGSTTGDDSAGPPSVASMSTGGMPPRAANQRRRESVICEFVI